MVMPSAIGGAAADTPGATPQADRLVVEVRVPGKTIWQVIGAVLLTLGLLWAVNAAWGVVSMVAISFFFSLALDPAVRSLTRCRGWRLGSAVGVIYAAGFLFTAFMIAVLIPAISELAKVIGENGAEWLSNIDTRLEDLFGIEFLSSSSIGGLAENNDIALQDWADEAFGAVLG